jgi:hypothetical protein
VAGMRSTGRTRSPPDCTCICAPTAGRGQRTRPDQSIARVYPGTPPSGISSRRMAVEQQPCGLMWGTSSERFCTLRRRVGQFQWSSRVRIGIPYSDDEWWADWPINGEENTHISGRRCAADPLGILTFERWHQPHNVQP